MFDPTQTLGITQPGVSWRNDLAAYIRCQGSALPAVCAKRDEVVTVVLMQPESATAWWNLLAHEVTTQPLCHPTPGLLTSSCPPSAHFALGSTSHVLHMSGARTSPHTQDCDFEWAPTMPSAVAQESCGACPAAAGQAAGRAAVPLTTLYDWATRLIPKHGHQDGEIYIKIWLGYARHQW